MKASNAVIELLKLVKELKREYPHKEFTLDGRLVGDIGEILVEESYDVKLYDSIKAKYDAETKDGKKVQIKATFKASLGFPCDESSVPDYYLGIKINHDGSFQEIYNGPGIVIWEAVKHLKVPKNNLYNVSIKKLGDLNSAVRKIDRISIKKM
jgi:hypothetical protein